MPKQVEAASAPEREPPQAVASRSAIPIEDRGQAHASIAEIFEQAADAMAILDQDGWLRYANASFEALRRALDPNETRHQAAPLDAPVFRALKSEFRALLAQTGELGPSARRFSCELGTQATLGISRQFIVFIAATLADGGANDGTRPSRFLLVLRELEAVQHERVLAMRKNHKLTAAETRVLHCFARGQNLSAIAAGLSLTIHTIRLHIKSLLSKTGCRRQAELMRLIETTPTEKIRLLI